MRLILCCLFLVAFVSIECKPGLSIDQFEKLVKHSKACREETGATAEMMTRVIAGDFPDEPVLKKQLFCISKRLGFQNDAGDLNKDAISQKLNTITGDPKLVEDIIQTCVKAKATPDVTAYDSFKCLFTEKGVNIFT